MAQNYFFGKKALFDAINNFQTIEVVYLAKSNYFLVKELQEKNINYQIKDNNWFKQFNDSLNHQNIAFTIKQKEQISQKDLLNQLNKKDSSVVLIVDSIEDPRNFGAILRTCDAFGIDGIFYKKNNQVGINDLVNKVSMGATNYLNLCEVANLNQIVQKLKENGYWIYATTLNKQAIPYYKEKFPSKVAIIVGNESNGISNLLIKESDVSIYIPMEGHVQSLNVSVATGIVLSYLKITR